MVLANVGNGITAGGDEVADVQVDADVGRGALHGPRKCFRGGELVRVKGIIVTMEAHHDLILLGVLINAGRNTDIR